MRIFVMICSVAAGFAASAVSSSALTDVRSALDTLVMQADQYELDDSALRAGFEIGKSNRVNVPASIYAPLVSAVSNHWEEVFGNVSSFGTNFAERVLLENTAWYLGDEAFLGALTMMCGNVATNALDVAELKLMVVNSCYNHYAVSAFYRKYHEPSVTNIIHELMRYGIMTNWCAEILSGHALERYNREVEQGAVE